MQVRNFGFAAKVNGSPVGLPKLLQEMERKSGDEIQLGSASRRIYLRRKVAKNFSAGVILTTRNQKNFCSLSDEEGRVIIRVKDLGGDRLVDFNFFVLNEENGLGLFQHYFHSCSPNGLGTHLGSTHRRLVKQEKAEFQQSFANPEKPTKREIKQLSAKFSGQFEFCLLITNKTLDSILKTLKRIRALEYSFDILDVARRPGVPIGPFVKRETKRYSFARDSPFVDLVSSIVRTIKEEGPSHGHVEGIEEIDGSEVPVTVKISDIAEDYGTYDFDALASKLNNLDVSAFYKHEIAKSLIHICTETSKHIFCAP